MTAIDRRLLVSRHNPLITGVEPDSPLTVGNGEFAFTADFTGLQSFPQAYRVPLGTQSAWGWHSSGGRGRVRHNQLRLTPFHTYGRDVGYAYDDKGQERPFHWLRQNPHRIQLGEIGFILRLEDGAIAEAGHAADIRQTLHLWEGRMDSSFTLEGAPVHVTTLCHPEQDLLVVQVHSALIGTGRLAVRIAYPSAEPVSEQWEESVSLHWSPEGHETVLQQDGGGRQALWLRKLDEDGYAVGARWSHGSVVRESEHAYVLTPDSRSGPWELAVCFGADAEAAGSILGFEETLAASRRHWQAFWQSGGAADFSESQDERAAELERRTVLSQYVTAVHCTGPTPPQETGLMYNSWFGKFHLEMHWWHSAHFSLWGRTPLLSAGMDWYNEILPKAKELAASQGYRGARWPKMVGPDGEQGPSFIAPLLIWQQPHPIMLAELIYRSKPDKATLERYSGLVMESAEFMASFAHWEEDSRRYVLGPPVISAQENHLPGDTVNPAFEVEYWRYGLKTAQRWLERQGLPRRPEWERVIKGSSPLPLSADGAVYLAHENCPDTYEHYNEDHPSMLGALGVLPGELVDKEVMERTLRKVVAEWQWDTAWGWDFPMAAMTASALGNPELALELLLMDKAKNTYLPNGHNYQRPGLSAYLPGNGGLLAAVAAICTGNSVPLPSGGGRMRSGSWSIQWEGLSSLHEFTQERAEQGCEIEEEEFR